MFLADIRFAGHVIKEHEAYATALAADAQMLFGGNASAIIEASGLMPGIFAYRKNPSPEKLQALLAGFGKIASSLAVDHALGGETQLERALALITGNAGEYFVDKGAETIAHVGGHSSSSGRQIASKKPAKAGKASAGFIEDLVEDTKKNLMGMAQDAMVENVKGHLPESLQNMTNTVLKTFGKGQNTPT